MTAFPSQFTASKPTVRAGRVPPLSWAASAYPIPSSNVSVLLCRQTSSSGQGFVSKSHGFAGQQCFSTGIICESLLVGLAKATEDKQ